MIRVWRRRKNDDGQALVEFALIVPALMLIMVGIFEVSHAWSIQHVLTENARLGARSAVVGDLSMSNATAVRASVQQGLSAAGLDTSKATITLGLRDVPGTPDTVRVGYPYQFSLLGKILSWVADESAITLQAQAVMRNE